jgi:flagellar protein FlaF
MGLQAYKQAAQRAENPREAEYRLFGQVTKALMEAARLDASDVAGRMDALDWNRRLWSALATDCSDPGNVLAPGLRASIISLSLWVGRHTSQVIRREETIEPLIEVNRMMMQGLSGGQQPA